METYTNHNNSSRFSLLPLHVGFHEPIAFNRSIVLLFDLAKRLFILMATIMVTLFLLFYVSVFYIVLLAYLKS